MNSLPFASLEAYVLLFPNLSKNFQLLFSPPNRFRWECKGKCLFRFHQENLSEFLFLFLLSVANFLRSVPPGVVPFGRAKLQPFTLPTKFFTPQIPTFNRNSCTARRSDVYNLLGSFEIVVGISDLT